MATSTGSKIKFYLMLLWLSMWVFVGLSILFDTPNQIKSDEIFVNNNIKPTVTYVKEYIKSNKYLPSDALIHEKMSQLITKSNQIPEELSYIKEIPENGWILAVWRGEWNEYYISWQEKYITNNYGWESGVHGLLYSIVVGAVPFCLLLLSRLKK